MPQTLKTTEKLKGSEVRQFSVFLNNKVGALLEIVKLLQENSIVVLAISVVDSSECSIARFIVSDPEKVSQLFEMHLVPSSECLVLLVEMAEGAEDLGKVLACLLMAEVNISFAYPLMIRPRGKAVLAVRVDDFDCAKSVLRKADFILLNQSDISR